jgi:beta-galactosidase
MLSHSGVASPVWAEVKEVGQELAQLGDFAEDAQVQAGVAIICSWPNWWALEAPAKPANDLTLADQVTWMYRPFYHSRVTVDFCRPDEPLGRYAVVLVPSLYLTTDDEAANIVAFVEAGGTAVISFWSGIVDEHDAVHLGPYGGPLRPLMGCDVLEVAPLPDGEVVDIAWEDGTTTTATFWADLAVERDGRVLARIASGPWAGRPAVVETSRGKGRAYYVATRLDPSGLERVYEQIQELSGKPGGAKGGPGLERVMRVGASHSYEFLINHSEEPRDIEIAPGGYDILARGEVSHRLSLPASGVAIVRREVDG